MATLVLGAVGGAVGGALGGSALGVSSAVIGRAVGSTLGQVIDQRYTTQGADNVAHGKIDRFRVTGAADGSAIPRLAGRLRTKGQVIWTSRFKEQVTTTTQGRGKGGGGGSSTTTTSYSYSISLAIALCEGEIQGIGRVWADGAEVDVSGWDLRIYTGDTMQLPDPLIEAVEGPGMAPAYRGTAYAVIEGLQLESFGNRVPQLSFEVFRHAAPVNAPQTASPMRDLKAVALIPGTGEYALATEPVYFEEGFGAFRPANVNTPTERTDFVVSVDTLKQEIPNAEAVTLVSCWFGDDLRCDRCTIAPRVEQQLQDGKGHPWAVAGMNRWNAQAVSQVNGQPAFGGTPTDVSMIQAMSHLKGKGLDIVLYPFLLMDVRAETELADPWNPSAFQPDFPWRGRLTSSLARGEGGSPQGSILAANEVASFFGSAQASDFQIVDGEVVYSGPAEWSYSRFILHHAALGAAAGGVSAITIGSEMRSLTQIMGENETFPAIAALIALAAEVRLLLPDAKIGYAADWSEYFGFQPTDQPGDVYFHLDPLWADANTDFIGIDNYMPLSDWRDGQEHADAHWIAPARDYFGANVAGGEGYDWYYPTIDARNAQRRDAIGVDPFDEPWMYRYKDIAGWWSNFHIERRAGQQVGEHTDWIPGSKPIWFTEFGCAAVDKGATQPNMFVDGVSAESGLPWYSDGTRNDFEQIEYFAAQLSYWSDPANNPESAHFEGRMIDTSRMFAWAWDARPWPAFPERSDLWADAPNHARGHWLNGRAIAQPMAAVIAELCEQAGMANVDVSKVTGVVRGVEFAEVQSVRAALQPLMIAYDVEAVDRGEVLTFRMAADAPLHDLETEHLAALTHAEGRIERRRDAQVDVADRLRLHHVQAEGDYGARTAESVWPGTSGVSVDTLELPLALNEAEALALVERLHATRHVGADAWSVALPQSRRDVKVGDIIRFSGAPGGTGMCKVTRIEEDGAQKIEAVSHDPSVRLPSGEANAVGTTKRYVQSVPAVAEILDLPLLRGTEDVHSPYVAVASRPWPASMAVHASRQDANYVLEEILRAPAMIGETKTALPRATPSVWDHGPALEVSFVRGALASVAPEQVLNGANLAAIRHGESGDWELFQFAKAELLAPSTWGLSMRLRGQRGTEFVIPDAWPIGSRVVILDPAITQLDRGPDEVGLPFHYRIGPAHLGYDHGTYQHRVHSAQSTGARCYAPSHLKAKMDVSGNVQASWVRRARVGADQWQTQDVPVGETQELYRWEVHDQSGGVVSGQSAATDLVISATALANLSGTLELEVAQVSEVFGPGAAARVAVSA